MLLLPKSFTFTLVPLPFLHIPPMWAVLFSPKTSTTYLQAIFSLQPWALSWTADPKASLPEYSTGTINKTQSWTDTSLSFSPTKPCSSPSQSMVSLPCSHPSQKTRIICLSVANLSSPQHQNSKLYQFYLLNISKINFYIPNCLVQTLFLYWIFFSKTSFSTTILICSLLGPFFIRELELLSKIPTQ